MKIIIENGDSSSYGPDAMANSLCICDCILKDAKDGDSVKASIEGTLVEHEGKRYISVSTVDGEPVEEMGDMTGQLEQDMQDASQDPMMMDAHDALAQFMTNKKYK